MSGIEASESDLDDMLQSDEREGHWLEFKHGDKFEKTANPAQTIRQYVSGFANSDGGIFIAGVDETTRNVTGCKAPGGGDLREWATRCANPISLRISPSPRFYVLPHPKGSVLIIAVYRSSLLVPCIESNREIYYLRVHDETLAAPPYLISDLLLGRRQHPMLNLYAGILELVSLTDPGANYNLTIRLRFGIENEGMSWAEGILIGTVFWSIGDESRLGQSLRASLDLRKPDTERFTRANFRICHNTQMIDPIRPFASAVMISDRLIILPLSGLVGWYAPYRWKAAVYVIAKASPPTWYQAEIDVAPPLFTLLQSPNANRLLDLPLKRIVSDRPIVDVEAQQLL